MLLIRLKSLSNSSGVQWEKQYKQLCSEICNVEFLVSQLTRVLNTVLLPNSLHTSGTEKLTLSLVCIPLLAGTAARCNAARVQARGAKV